MAGLLEQEKWTPYEPTLAGRAKGIWDGLFMSNEAIDLQNQQYKTHLANTQAAPILNNPAQAGGTVLRENATGNLLDMTPEQIATALPLMQKYQGTNQKGPYYDPLRSGQLVGASTDQQAAAYSPQQLGQLGNIPGYADQARQLMVNQARDKLELLQRGVTVNQASLSSMQAEKESRELIDFLDPNSLQNQQKRAAIASSSASAAHTRGTEARAESDWASRNYLMENGVLNAEGKLPEVQKPTEAMYASRGFLQRMQEVESGLSQLPANQIVPSNLANSLYNSEGLYTGAIGNKLLTPVQQQYMQYASDWITAKLRKESGAQIAKGEFNREYRQYFPQPDDDAKTIAQKTKARQTATRQLAITGGLNPDATPNKQGNVIKLD